jgi:hypothetical protein
MREVQILSAESVRSVRILAALANHSRGGAGRARLTMPSKRVPWRFRPADSTGLWRKRVGVEPTILAAKDRINGFEGHEDHRTSFASASIIGTTTGGFNFSGR